MLINYLPRAPSLLSEAYRQASHEEAADVGTHTAACPPASLEGPQIDRYLLC